MNGIEQTPTSAEIGTLASRFWEREGRPGKLDLQFRIRAARALEGSAPFGRMTLAEGLREVDDRLVALAENERAERLCTLRRGLDETALRVVVFGEFNRGKSTLINALIGRAMLPASLVPTTGHLIRVRAGIPGGKDEAHISFRNGRVEQCALDALEGYTVLNEQGLARENVAEVEITICGCPLLDAGVVLVDTPGLNDHEAQTARAKSAITQADVVLLVLDARTLLTESERSLAVDWLGRSLGKTVVPLVNFMNLLPPSDWGKVRGRLHSWSRGTTNEELGRPWFEVNAQGALKHALGVGSSTADHFNELRGGLVGLTGERRRLLQRRSRRGQLLFEVREVRARNKDVLERLCKDADRVDAERNKRRDVLLEGCRHFDADANGARVSLMACVEARMRADADKLEKAMLDRSKSDLESNAGNQLKKMLSRAALELDQRADKALSELVMRGGDARSMQGALRQAEPMTARERMILNDRVAVGVLPMIAVSNEALGGGTVVGGALGTWLIPVPVVGTVVGMAVGGWLASFFGETEPDYGQAYAVEVRKHWDKAADKLRDIINQQFDVRCAQLRNQLESQLEVIKAVGAQSTNRERLQRESLETLLELNENVLAAAGWLGNVSGSAAKVVGCAYLANGKTVDVAQLAGTSGDPRFYILSKSGHICSAELHEQSQITSNRSVAKDWEFFEILKAADGRIALRAHNGKYVSADRNNGGMLVANRDRIEEWELFTVEQHGDYVAFKTGDGKYVSRREDQHCVLSSSVPHARDWEMFKLMKAAV